MIRKTHGTFVSTRRALLTSLLATPTLVHSATWSGADGNWNASGNPGWNGTGTPNAIGAIATFNATGAARETTQNISAGVTVGTLSLTGTNVAGSRAILLTGPITLNQDGSGAGTALIENRNTSTSNLNFFQIGSTNSQRIILADNLRVTNTAGSAAAGSVYLQGAIEGAGNITFNNGNSGIRQDGSIRLGGATNTFTGNVLVQKGTVAFSSSASLGNASNAVTLGESGQGNAALLATASGSTIQQSITVATGSGGILTLGKINSGDATYSGKITLNGDVNLHSEASSNAGLNFTGEISGSGSITIAPGVTGSPATGITTFSAANTFTGNTNIGSPAVGSASRVVLANSLSLQNSTLSYTGTTPLVFSSTVASHAFTLGGLTGSSNIALQDNATTPNAVTLSVGNNNSSPAAYSGALTGAGSLTKVGTGALTLTGANTYTGPTSVNQGSLIVGSGGVGSIRSNVTVQNSGTLGGSGLVTGNVTSLNGGKVAAGNGTGLLQISGSLSLDPGSIFMWELASQTTSGRGTNYDAVNVGLDLLASDSVFNVVVNNLDLNASFWDTTRSWQVFDKGLTTGTGFSSFQLFSAGDPINPISYGSEGNFSFDTATGSLIWSAVPEPATAFITVITGLGMLLTRRREARES